MGILRNWDDLMPTEAAQTCWRKRSVAGCVPVASSTSALSAEALLRKVVLNELASECQYGPDGRPVMEPDALDGLAVKTNIMGLVPNAASPERARRMFPGAGPDATLLPSPAQELLDSLGRRAPGPPP